MGSRGDPGLLGSRKDITDGVLGTRAGMETRESQRGVVAEEEGSGGRQVGREESE